MVFKLRLFKNRGDIYIPQTKFKSDLEQKILIALLAFVVFFTAVFLLIFGIKYNFSVKEFFTPDSLKSETQEVEEVLPQVSGKTNYLFIMSNKNTDEMYMCTLFQVDMDNISYTACTLSPKTSTESGYLSDIYAKGGASAVLNSLNKFFGIEIDFYIDQSYDDFSDMYDSLGKVNYTVLNDVKYKDTSRYGYNIKISAGEQSLSGDTAQKLLRYYVLQENNYSAANDIVLASVSQFMNEENYEKRESLFSKFIEKSTTNITVKDFTEKNDNMKVLSSSTTGVTVFNTEVKYDSEKVTSSSVNEILGSFSK